MEKGIIVCPSSLVKNWGNELGESLFISSRLFLAFTDLFAPSLQSNGSDLVSSRLSQSTGREGGRSSSLL